MSLTVKCPCGSIHEMPDEWAGKRGKCPDCGRVLAVPRPRAQRRPAPTPKPDKPEERKEPSVDIPKPMEDEDFVPFEMKDPEESEFADGLQTEQTKQGKEEAVKMEGGVVSFKCACGKALRAPLDKVGMKAKCPRCHQAIEVPKPPVKTDADEVFEYASEEDSGVTQCANCGADMQKGAIVCVQCGTNKISGEKVDTKVGDEAFADEQKGLKDVLGKVAFWKKKTAG